MNEQKGLDRKIWGKRMGGENEMENGKRVRVGDKKKKKKEQEKNEKP